MNITVIGNSNPFYPAENPGRWLRAWVVSMGECASVSELAFRVINESGTASLLTRLLCCGIRGFFIYKLPFMEEKYYVSL